MADAGPSKGFFQRVYDKYASSRKKKKFIGPEKKTEIDPVVTAAIQKKKGDYAAGEHALKGAKTRSESLEESERRKLMAQFRR